MFRLKNKNLTISIEDPNDNETDAEIHQRKITLELSNYQSTSSLSSLTQTHLIERKKLLSKSNTYLIELLDYMESGNYIIDISYKHLTQNSTIKSISNSIFLSNEQMHNRNIQSEYNILKLITDTQEHKSNQVALSKNLKRGNNRYAEIVPYKYNVVPYQQLTHFDNDNINEWYINASYINGPFKSDEKMFIAAQGPLQSTVTKFFKMCIYNDIKLLIMLCSFEEEGRKKCERYLPNELNIERVYDDNIKVTLLKEEWMITNCILKKEIRISYEGVTKYLYHLQMVNWPDYSRPDERSGFDTINRLIREIAEFRDNYNRSPVLLHCSAGTGRTGTLIAIFNLVKCLSFFNKVNYDSDVKPFFSVFNMVRRLREQRQGMVCSIEQYTFIYEFIIRWIRENVDGV